MGLMGDMRDREMQRRSNHYAEAVKTIEQDGEDYPASVML
jgi:hypothetical protein